MRIRAAAEREAAEIVADAHRRADAFAEARIERVRALTDRLLAAAAGLDRRFAGAADVQRQLDDLVGALGAAAERVAREARSEPARDAPEPERTRRGPGGAVVEVVADTRPPRDVS